MKTKARISLWAVILLTLALVIDGWSAGAKQSPIPYNISITAVNSNLASGTISAGSSADIQLRSDENSVAVHIDGTYAATLAAYETVDGIHRYAISSALIRKQSDATSGITANATGDWTVSAPAGSHVYVFCTAYSSGTAKVTLVGGWSVGPTPIPDGGNVTLGAKADAKSAATDTTAVSAMQVLKEMSYLLQNPSALASGTNTIGYVRAVPTQLTGSTTVSVANVVAKINSAGSGTWQSDTADPNSGVDRIEEVTNNDVLGGQELYVNKITAGAPRLSTVSSSTYLYDIAPGDTRSIPVPAGYELTCSRGSAAAANVTIQELGYK